MNQPIYFVAKQIMKFYLPSLSTVNDAKPSKTTKEISLRTSTIKKTQCLRSTYHIS